MLLNAQLQPIGTRIFGPITRELRGENFMKIIYPEVTLEESIRRAQQVWSDEEYIYYTIDSVKETEKVRLSVCPEAFALIVPAIEPV